MAKTPKARTPVIRETLTDFIDAFAAYADSNGMLTTPLRHWRGPLTAPRTGKVLVPRMRLIRTVPLSRDRLDENILRTWNKRGTPEVLGDGSDSAGPGWRESRLEGAIG
jgi:hypothetical protein